MTARETPMATAAPTQDRRQMAFITPLGKDVLLAQRFHADEAISQLFTATAEAIADKSKTVAFDQLLGKLITVQLTLAGGTTFRYFNGMCNGVSQGESDVNYTRYSMSLVPQEWLLTKVTQS